MEKYIPRFFQTSEQSYFLFGPRGTGKSTFLKQHYPKALWVDLLKPDVFRNFTAHPERIAELVQGNPEARTVVVDEIQKAPEMLSAIHSLIEQKTGKQFILTGSSARKLKRTGVNLLAGRVLLRMMHPFMLAELDQNTSLDDALKHGLLPVVTTAMDKHAALEAYTTLYIREEVQMEGLVRNIGNFSRFLEAVSFSHGSVLNISAVARECQVERKVVEGYLTILEDILLAFRIPVFTKRAKRNLVTHPKFYFFDAGVFTALRPKGPLDRPEEIGGAALEGLIGQNLIAWNAHKDKPFEFFYWRSRGGLEVDFVLYGEEGLHAFEVKNTARVRPEDLRGLKAFRQDYPIARTVLLYRGHERLMVNEIQCLPCEEFLRQLTPGFSLQNTALAS